MDSQQRRIVAVQPGAALTTHRRLFTSLEQVYPVRFAAWRRDAMECDALIVAGDRAGPVPTTAVPTLAFVGDPAASGPAEDVRLGDQPAVDRRLRGIVLHGHSRGGGPPTRPSDDVLAIGRWGPRWTRSRGPVPVDRVWAAVPELQADEVLRDALRTNRALGLIALVHFVRALADDGWQAPALRATFLFDDPNLRRPTYGHLDYRRLVAHADAHGYHAAMAMIPLDARWPNAKVVELFRARPDRLSLAFHGNNHLRRELMYEDPRGALAMCAQAVRRIARFEGRTGLSVDRIMVPPHGLCSPAVAWALGLLGYDALCAIHPCPWTECPPADRLLAGWGPADFVSACAVVPRFPLGCSEAEVALRAFLGQPLILYGHHDDVAGGLEPLAQAAARVNRLGEVRWCSLRDIVATNYALRIDGDTAEVAAFGRRVRVTRPRDAAKLVVHAPVGGAEAAGLAGWSVPGSPRMAFGAPLVQAVDRDLVVRLHAANQADAWDLAAPAWQPWPLLRRAATETRDRLLSLRAARG
jgi:hypothetical protein